MSDYFFDTSALLKRYVPENGTKWTETTVSATHHAIYIAQITKVEFASAIYRRLREGSLSQDGADDAMLLFRRHLKYQYNVVRLTNILVIQAQNILSKHPLRAYDAVQLVSALTIGQALASPVHFVCADIRLLNVAHAEGLLPINPNTQL